MRVIAPVSLIVSAFAPCAMSRDTDAESICRKPRGCC